MGPHSICEAAASASDFQRRYFKKIKSLRLAGKRDSCCSQGTNSVPPIPGVAVSRTWPDIDVGVTPGSAGSGLSGSSVELAYLGSKHAAATRDGGKEQVLRVGEKGLWSSLLLVWNLK